MRSSDREKFRHEWKFLIPEGEKEVLCQKLGALIHLDEHASGGGYLIRSLYFDDIWENSYEEKLAGVSSRKKYRLRTYDYGTTEIFLECKKKEEQYVKKTSAKLNREEAERMMAEDYEFLRDRKEPVCQDFYIDHKLALLKPKVIVDYNRIPYVFTAGDVRITFDSHVRAGILKEDLFDRNLPVLEVLEPGQLILEVKFTEFLPYFVRDLLPREEGVRVAASKYVMCLEKRKEFS